MGWYGDDMIRYGRSRLYVFIYKLYGTGRLDDEENSFYSPELIWRARAKAAGMIPKAVWVAKMAWLPKNGLGPSKLGMPSMHHHVSPHHIVGLGPIVGLMGFFRSNRQSAEFELEMGMTSV